MSMATVPIEEINNPPRSGAHRFEAGGGVFRFTSGGVEVYIKHEADVSYILVNPEHDKAALALAERIAGLQGYELMPEWECPAEILPDGTTRHWLAERWDMDDSSFSETF